MQMNAVVNKNFYIEKSSQQLEVKLLVDFINRRLKVVKYRCSDYDILCRELYRTAQKYKLEKILLIAKSDDWKKFFVKSFVLEALHPAFYDGEDGFHMSLFLAADRFKAENYILHKKILQTVISHPKSKLKPLGQDFSIDSVARNDIKELTELYSKIFKTYPTPINDPDYFKKMLHKDYIFKVVRYKGNIVSAASLDINMTDKNAELTDCATLKDYGGKGLMANIIKALEQEAKQKGLRTIYTIARACSIGINKVFYNQEYEYCGQLIKNCDICGQFEDMNVWSKII
ncbi:putative beta-lysine N-acetyltransferase [Pectinatus sottacetonis]|uniref:putative beta-lysine N-acetyltransferase n=1 Tax=Pectinatus sottacetonis TaxID=1002795 RepID=UPI0018C461D7|nr:putative beta-lysine N-acetyltransferase [Pectinatus sottacetonis]